jgi:hypothetical protein
MTDIAKWIFGFALVSIVSVPVYGLLISATWAWFIAPIFGIREISMAEGIGLSFFVTALMFPSISGNLTLKPGVDDGIRTIAAKGLGQAIGQGVVAPVLLLSLAWVWHLVVMVRTQH